MERTEQRGEKRGRRRPGKIRMQSRKRKEEHTGKEMQKLEHQRCYQGKKQNSVKLGDFIQTCLQLQENLLLPQKLITSITEQILTERI